MKAAVIGRPGAVPSYEEFAEPVAPEGREVVELVATGIHPLVRALAAGEHYGSEGAYPLVPGVDAVARTADGRLVYTGYVRAPWGTQAERMAVPAGMGTPLPDGADPVSVAGGMNPGLSSWFPLRQRLAGERPLRTVLVLGATGLAGRLAVQNALALGATRVVAAGRDATALAELTHTPVIMESEPGPTGAGGVVTVRLGTTDDGAALAEALDGVTPDVVLDYVWGAPAEAAFAALGRTGLAEDDADVQYVEIGQAAGATAALPASLLRSRRISVTGSGAGSLPVARIMAELPAYLELIADGRVQVPTRTFPLSEVAAAWAASEESGRRVVVTA